MDKAHTDIRKDLHDIAAWNIPAFTRDLTYNEIRGMLVTVRQLKTRLEVLWAEKENDI